MSENISFKINESGNCTIYPEQAIAAEKICDIFESEGGPPLLIAQPQQGKTGVAIAVIKQFVITCKKYNQTYQVIYLSNISDCVLKSQIEDRLEEARLFNEVIIEHHAGLNKPEFKNKLNLDVDRRLIIVDECHVALRASDESLNEYRPFHEFLKTIGCNYGKSISTWKNKNNYVLSISATPYAHVIKVKLDEKSFETVPLTVSEKYFSLQDIHKRLYQSDDVVSEKSVTFFFKEKLKEFHDICKNFNEGNGYLIIRSTVGGPDIIKDYIRTTHPEINVKIYDSNTKNIHELDDRLSKCPTDPFVAIIKGALRAGKTLKTTKYIRMWIEPPRSTTDTMCQVVGRCLGYPSKLDGHSKFDDKFPIYCNIKERSQVIEFYQKYDVVPSGHNNLSTRQDKSEPKYERAVLNSEEEARADWKSRTGKEFILRSSGGDNAIRHLINQTDNTINESYQDMVPNIINKKSGYGAWNKTLAHFNTDPNVPEDKAIIDNLNEKDTERVKEIQKQLENVDGENLNGKWVYLYEVSPSTSLDKEISPDLFKNNPIFS